MASNAGELATRESQNDAEGLPSLGTPPLPQFARERDLPLARERGNEKHIMALAFSFHPCFRYHILYAGD